MLPFSADATVKCRHFNYFWTILPKACSMCGFHYAHFRPAIQIGYSNYTVMYQLISVRLPLVGPNWSDPIQILPASAKYLIS